MKEYMLTAGLLLGLSSLAAFGQQTATTPGTPSPHDPNYQSNTIPDASSRPQSTDRDRGTGDQYPDAGRDQRDQDQNDRSQDGYNRGDRTQSNSGYGNGYGESGYRDEIQSVLQQQSNLAGVQVSEAGTRIELTGSVPTGRDRRQALRIAQDYAHGREVVDRIQVAGNGRDRDHDRDEQH